ncbi:MAG: ATP-grasp domain-containing protein [Phycicoccus sp.]
MKARSVVLCKWQEELVTALLDRGGPVHLVTDTLDRLAAPDAAALARCRSTHEVVSFDSVEQVASVAVDLRLLHGGADVVLGHQEIAQSGAAHLAGLLGIEPDPWVATGRRHKAAMKSLVAEHGVRTAGWTLLPEADPAAVVEVVTRVGLQAPWVLKPVLGFGSTNTVTVRDVDELAGAVRQLVPDPMLRSKALMVEEFVDGVEFAVDALWSGGEERYFVVHRYHDPRMTVGRPTASTMDGSLILNPEQHSGLYAAARDMHRKINAGLGITEGPTHLEIFQCPDGEIVFSEISARIGGGWIPSMLSLHFGRSVWEMFADQAATGEVATATVARPHLASVSLHPDGVGVVVSTPTDEELGATPGVVSWTRVRGAGARARLQHASDFYLHVIVEAPDEVQLLERCHHILENRRILTDPVPVPG